MKLLSNHLLHGHAEPSERPKNYERDLRANATGTWPQPMVPNISHGLLQYTVLP